MLGKRSRHACTVCMGTVSPYSALMTTASAVTCGAAGRAATAPFVASLLLEREDSLFPFGEGTFLPFLKGNFCTQGCNRFGDLVL
jgi:hypothetical protein